MLRWLRRCGRDPGRLSEDSALQGRWQLRFDVVLTEPALQKVLVEAKGKDGAWGCLHSLGGD